MILKDPIVIDDTADTANDTTDHDRSSKKSKGLTLSPTKSVLKPQFKHFFAY